jgi:disulfide bond formation protein DsbB
MKKKIKIRRSTVERAIYILIVIGLVIYGIKDSEVSVKLIHGVMEAFSILLNIA